ncbi:unnamed protein product [Closterium sp. NIES-65]|nr:unnamed protein product [Closterium sp. NIES-65]
MLSHAYSKLHLLSRFLSLLSSHSRAFLPVFPLYIIAIPRILSLRRQIYRCAFKAQTGIYRCSFKKQTGVSLKNMMAHGAFPTERNLLSSAQFLQQELPVRLAHRVTELENLPYGLSTKAPVLKVRDWYVDSFKDIRGFPAIESREEELRFTHLLAQVKMRHNNVIPTMAMGINELKQDLGRKGRLDDLLEIHQFLDRFYMSRIGIRMLIGQHVALHDPNPPPHFIGLICTKVSPVDVARNAVDDARSACMRTYGSAPEVEIYGDPDFTFAYVPTHLHQMVFELCKNSLRAVQERFADADTDPPPIRVVVADGIEDVTIKLDMPACLLLPPSHQHALFPLCCAPSSFPRCCAASLYLQISDEGGGIPHSGLPHIRTYLYSTARLPAATSHSPPCHLPPCDVCPPHPTHPFQISDEGGGIPRSGLPRIWTYLYSTARSPAAAGALQDTPSIMCVPVVGWLGGGSGEMLMCGGLCTIAVPSAESPSTSDDPLGAERQYRGVRQRRWGRWVSEIREPRRGLRIWLGSHSSAEQAARVYDVAVRLLRGDGAILNFPNDQREVLLPPAIAETLIHACAALSSKDSLPDADSTAPLRPLLSSAHTRVAPSSSDSLPRGATAEPCAALAAPGSLAEEGVSLTAAAALMGTGTGDSAGSGGEDEQRGEVEGESVEEMVEEQQEKLQQQEQEVWGDELETLLACEQQIRQQVAQEQAEGEQVEEEQAGEEQAEGEQAEGEQAEGEQAEGEQAEGEQGEGEQAEGEQAKEEQVVEEQAEGEQQGGEQEWQVDWLLACEQLPLDEFTVCDSEPEGALLARAPLAAHTLTWGTVRPARPLLPCCLPPALQTMP